MSRGWTYISGDWNLVCDSCAKKIKASKSKHRWDGFIVCADCWEPRHSLDFIRARNDKITVPFTRPQSTDTFIEYDWLLVESSTTTDPVYIYTEIYYPIGTES